MDERSNHNLPSVVDLDGGPFWTPVRPLERWWGSRDLLQEKKGSRDQLPMVVFAVPFLSLAAPLRSDPRRFVRLANPLGTLVPLGVSCPSYWYCVMGGQPSVGSGCPWLRHIQELRAPLDWAGATVWALGHSYDPIYEPEIIFPTQISSDSTLSSMVSYGTILSCLALRLSLS